MMNTFRYLLCALCLSLSVSAGTAQKRAALPPGLDNYINKVLQTFQVPGAAVSIVQNGKVLLAKGYGVKKAGENNPVDQETLFLIASNTKAFTATALAMLVEEGRIKWEDPVIDHLPWFRMSDHFVTMHLTIRDLLVHHSGLPAYAGDIMLFPPSSYSRREILNKLKHIPLIHDFRTVYAYDNILYLVAGEVIAAVSGMSWEDFIKTRIFDNVGMLQSVSRFSSLKNKTNVAIAHAQYDGQIKVADKFRDQNIGDAANPAGGIVSNATDMANWLITQLDSGRTPLNNRIFNPGTTIELWKMVTPMPISIAPEALKPSQRDFWAYTLGFRTYNYKQYKIVGHGGALKGFVSQIAMVPNLKLGVSVLTNQQSTGAYWSIINHVLDYYMQNKSFDWLQGYKKQQDSALANSRERRKKLAVKKDSLDKPSLPIEKYAGLYSDLLIGNIYIIQESTGLVLSFENSPHFVADLEYFQYNTFIARFRNMDFEADAYITFFLNPDGTVGQVKLKVVDPDSVLDFDDLLLKPVNKKIMDTNELKKSISAEFAKHPDAVFAVAFKDLSSGKIFFINEQDNFHAASTMKTPVLIETYKQAAANKFSINDSILVKNTFRSIVDDSAYSLDTTDDSEKDLYLLLGTKLPISDLLYRMITKSSNLATNIVIDLVGAKNVMGTMKSLGANKIQVLRGVEDNKAFQQGLNNTTTAFDLMLLFEQMANGKIINKKSCDAMIKILMAQDFRDVIPAKLPADMKTATKSGSIKGICHDSGIVYLPDGRKYVVVLLSRGIEDHDMATDALANVSKCIYDYIK